MSISAWWKGCVLLLAVLMQASSAYAGPQPETAARVIAAIVNVETLVRVEKVGYATFWDGNKYIQCRPAPARELRCEAAGSRMQPSLERVLVTGRLDRLAELGWVLDPSFGNHVRIFRADIPRAEVADAIVAALAEVYDADISRLDIATAWVADMSCPPRNGPSQNLAGIVNDAPEMSATAIWECSYVADPRPGVSDIAGSAEALVAIYRASTAAEIQRLRINAGRRVFVVFETDIGYVQCMPESAPTAIYCEAQSVESWPALAAILTPARVAVLHGAGYSDPGRSPNYAKLYAVENTSDTAIASEILTLLYEVYGYTGAAELRIVTETR